MLKKLSAISAIVYLSVYFVAAQTPMVQSSPATEQDEVVKISTNLVQVDAVVIDKDGKQITNLKADDFEIFQDSKPQNITQFSGQLHGSLKNNVPSSYLLLRITQYFSLSRAQRLVLPKYS